MNWQFANLPFLINSKISLMLAKEILKVPTWEMNETKRLLEKQTPFTTLSTRRKWERSSLGSISFGVDLVWGRSQIIADVYTGSIQKYTVLTPDRILIGPHYPRGVLPLWPNSGV